MDTIFMAILDALTIGALTGVSDTAKQAIEDGYGGFKRLLSQKLGTGSQVVEAIDALEQKPDSQDCQKGLLDQLTAENAGNDSELLKAAQMLREQVKTLLGGERHVRQEAHGTGIAQAAGSGNASVHMEVRESKKNV